MDRHANFTLRGYDNVVRQFRERDQIVTKLVTPTVLAKARAHFGCPTLNGVELGT